MRQPGSEAAPSTDVWQNGDMQTAIYLCNTHKIKYVRSYREKFWDGRIRRFPFAR
jgi:hypothetical protein